MATTAQPLHIPLPRPAPPRPRQVVLAHCFRPGDIVRAVVVSLGDARSYYLSTASNECGVVYAKSIAGQGGGGALRGLVPACLLCWAGLGRAGLGWAGPG